jgi:hypothetical protein
LILIFGRFTNCNLKNCNNFVVFINCNNLAVFINCKNVLYSRACVNSLIFVRILSKFAGNILRLTIGGQGLRTARVRLSMDGFSSFHKSHKVAWATYLSCPRAVKNVLIFLFWYAGHILQMPQSYMDYILIMITHRTHSCKRSFASERMINCSLIYWRIFTDYIQITTSSMDYVRFIFTHSADACGRVRACVWFSVRLSLDGFSSNLLETYYKSPQVAWATYFSWRVCVMS